MRRIMLTSSQVSVLVTSFVIISCTVALFLSGYVIQQRTLRHLRASIRPRQSRPRPEVYLPEKFRTTKVLEDGTVIQIESEFERERREEEERQRQQQQEPVIEVRPTEQHEDPPADAADEGTRDVSQDKLAMLESLQGKAAEKSWGVAHPDPLANSKVPISRAERRRLIREEIQRLSRSDERVYYQRRLW